MLRIFIESIHKYDFFSLLSSYAGFKFGFGVSLNILIERKFVVEFAFYFAFSFSFCSLSSAFCLTYLLIVLSVIFKFDKSIFCLRFLRLEKLASFYDKFELYFAPFSYSTSSKI